MRIEIRVPWLRNSVAERDLMMDSKRGRQDETVPEDLSKKAKEIWKMRKYGIFPGIAFRVLDSEQSIQQLSPADMILLGHYLSQELAFHDKNYFTRWPQSHPVYRAYNEVVEFINYQVVNWGLSITDDNLKDWLIQVARHAREKICPDSKPV